MNRLSKYFLITGLASLGVFGAVACGDDETDSDNVPGSGGKSGSGGEENSGGKSDGSGGKSDGSGGKSDGSGGSGGSGDGGSKTDGGGGDGGDNESGGASGSGGQTGSGGGGGGPTCDLSRGDKATEDIPLEVTSNMTLTADKVWKLKGITHVTDGHTLTIEPCTRIEGQKDPIAVLVISRGAKIDAKGTKDAPVLFTSDKADGARAAGDWGGLVLLGKAKTNDGEALVEGLPDNAANRYGGQDDADNSGTLQYVRIEFAGYKLAENVEVNGLTMGSVGTGTKIDHIQVSHGLDDCFEWFGGTVNLDHIICNGDGDDMFDMDRGYHGTVEYAFGRKTANPSSDPNGFEWDNNNANHTVTPKTRPTMKNATLCGFGEDIGVRSYGAVLRRGIEVESLDNVVWIGFDFGIDTRDNVGTNAAPNISISNSTVFGSPVANASETDNDSGFNETAWFSAGTGNTTDDPGFEFSDCGLDGSPPDASLTGSDKGAFKGGNWLDEPWLDWTKN